MVIRDLTLRSAASFGSFHLIRLLYDEYMFYLVEHKVAAATGETPIAVMGEVRQVCRESKHGPHSVLSLVVITNDVVGSNLSKTETGRLMKNTEKPLTENIGMIRSRIEINTDFGLDRFYYSRAQFNFGMF